jgi:hypothetical protein
MKRTLLLIKSIGLPDITKGENPLAGNIPKLIELAKLNNIPLLFLKYLDKVSTSLKNLAEFYENEHRKALDLIIETSELLDNLGLNYVIFKKMKPFPFTPADIGVLLPSERSY